MQALQKSFLVDISDTSLTGRGLDFLHLVFICDISSDFSCREIVNDVISSAV